MTDPDFAPIADSLRREVIAFYRERGVQLTGRAGQNTLETNSGFVERRGRPLLQILLGETGEGSMQGWRVLDLGCGFGALSLFFAAHGALVTGIDPNRERLEVGRSVAARHQLPVEFRTGRMQSVESPDRSFDLAVLNNSLCYVVSRRERQAALEETRRLLRPGGFLIMRNPNRWHPVDQFSDLPLLQLLPPRGAARLAQRLGRERSMVRLTSPLEARRELKAAGFTAIEHLASPSSRWPPFTKSAARYQHLLAQRAD